MTFTQTQTLHRASIIDRPPSVVISEVITSGVNGTLIYAGELNGKPSYTDSGNAVGDGPGTELSYTGTAWKLERFFPVSQVYEATVTSSASTPDGLTFTVNVGTGTPTVTALP